MSVLRLGIPKGSLQDATEAVVDPSMRLGGRGDHERASVEFQGLQLRQPDAIGGLANGDGELALDA